jgi:CRISPR-associated endoribonuclease Cas6
VSGPSGLADPPRPFVFRARHLDGATLLRGENFHFDLHLFTAYPAARQAVGDAFADAARAGIGPGRGRAEMRRTEAEPVSIDLAPIPTAPTRVRVEFLSPTELKHEGEIVQRPQFDILFARIRDRVSTLRELYGPGALEIDFAGMGARASAVQMTACGLRHVDVERRSSRTGQTHPIGGFTGWAEYEGPLAEFLPFLEAARWTGVGRQAVWGKGEIYTQSTG